jgi:hypothetical protein
MINLNASDNHYHLELKIVTLRIWFMNAIRDIRFSGLCWVKNSRIGLA